MIEKDALRYMLFELESKLWHDIMNQRGRGGGGASHDPLERTDNKVVAQLNVSTDEGYQERYRITVQIEALEDDHRESFWREHIDRYDDRSVIVGKEHYRIGRDGEPRAFSGFGGRRFDIQFNDGRKIRTHNLWYQGIIPPKWRDVLAPNAKFVDFDLVRQNEADDADSEVGS